MFLIDDLILFPIKGILAVFREIYQATEQDAANEEEAIRTNLSDLYMKLETGGMTEEEFDQQEKELLDRLDEIDAIKTLAKDEDEDGDQSEDDDEDGESEAEVEGQVRRS